jgi:hypothetical protein
LAEKEKEVFNIKLVITINFGRRATARKKGFSGCIITRFMLNIVARKFYKYKGF